MSKAILLLGTLLIVAGIPGDAGAETVRRFLLAVGANSGGPDRGALQYAVSDAERFADVMARMGGVENEDRTVLRQPDETGFRRALEGLREAVAAGRATAGRIEVLVYYSGHADGEGLLIGGERFSYLDLRRMVDGIDADVRITVLDACASGAITRIKGGQRRQAFLVDESSDMKGYAFLTSSSMDETAQESDVIGSSFFTHYLVSGMRGAADVSGEGKVTLSEAYQFAFHETLARTTDTQGGAQHPAYHINLSGTGDVVMTDVRQTSAGLILPENLNGRFFVRNAGQQLVAELFKPSGRIVELGLEPGTYSVHLDQEPTLLLAEVELEGGSRLVLEEAFFESVGREETALRGPYRRTRLDRGALGALSRRNRLELRLGGWARGPLDDVEGVGGVSTRVGAWGLLLRLSYSHWFAEDLSFGIEFSSIGADVESHVGSEISVRTLGMVSLFLEGRKYLPRSTLPSPLRPHLSLGFGTLIAEETAVVLASTEVNSMAAVGVRPGGGLDMQLSRHFMLGVQGAYNLFTDFSESFGGRRNYSGFEGTVGFSWLFGKGPGR